VLCNTNIKYYFIQSEHNKRRLIINYCVPTEYNNILFDICRDCWYSQCFRSCWLL